MLPRGPVTILVSTLVVALGGCAEFLGGCDPEAEAVVIHVQATGPWTNSTLDLARGIPTENGYEAPEPQSGRLFAKRAKDMFYMGPVGENDRLRIEYTWDVPETTFRTEDAAEAFAMESAPAARAGFNQTWQALQPTGWRLHDEPMASPQIVVC